jgi:WD40 repeat protein
VFRDDASLSANPDLWASITRALDESEFFILLASPAAAASPWVAKEAEYWLAHRSTDRMLVVLTEGELFWVPGKGVDRTRTSALPEPLDDAFDEEPRYVDLRWARSDTQLAQRDARFRSAVADLAAPLHGRSKDEMLGEDVRQHRRTLRIAWSAAAVLAGLMLAASVLAVLAVQQRNRARTQASIALSRQLATASAAELDGDPAVASLLALEAYRRVHSQPADRRYDARNAMLVALQRDPRLLATLATPDARTAVFSPDGDRVVTGDTHGKLKFWDARDGHPLGRPSAGLGAAVSALAYSPDGKTVAVGDAKGRVTFWGPTGVRQRSEALHTARRISRIAFSPNGRELAVIGNDGPPYGQVLPDRVRIWEMRNLRRGPRLLGEADEINGAAFTADGAALVTTGSDSANVWTVRGPARHLRVSWAYDVTTARDGRVLLLAERSGAAQLIDAFGGKPFGPKVPHHAGDFLNVAPGGRVFMSGPPQTLWNVRGRRIVREALPGGGGSGYAIPIFSPDGTMFAFDTGRVQLFAARDQNPLATVLRPARKFVEDASAVALAPDVAAAALYDETSLTFWNVRRGGGTTRPLRSSPESMALSPDGSLLATGGFSGDVTFWDTNRHAMIPTARGPHHSALLSLTFSTDGKKLTTRSADGVVQVWDTSRRPPVLGTRTKTAPMPTCHRGPNADEGSCVVSPTSVAVEPDGTLVFGTLGGVGFWDPGRGRSLGSLGVLGNQIALAGDGVTLATVDTLDFGPIRLWDLSRRQAIGLPLRDPRGTSTVAFGSDGAELVSGSAHGSVTIWDRQLFRTDFDSWRTRLCRLAGRNLTTEEWARFLPDERYRKTCTALP